MKKFISALLVVMMLVSMIPATDLTTNAAESTWTLVTDLAALEVGDQVIIVAQGANNALSTTQNSNNRASAAITKSDNTATITDAVQVLELQAGVTAGTFAFYTGSGYLYAASGTKNYLRTETTLSANSSWNITIADTGVATVKATGSNARNWMRYNASNNPPIFSCYGSGQADICLYKLTVAEENACQHANTHEEGYVAPTCTATGWTAAVICDDCGEKQKASTEIPMIPHDIVDGVCSACGAVAYVLVTDISKLHVGSQILIVATEADYTISTTQGSNNRPQAAVSKAEDKSYVSFGEDAQILTVEAGSEVGTYAFNTGAGYLYAAGDGGNWLRTKAELDATGSWTIEIAEDGIATIKSAADIEKNWLRYNENNGIFSCYASGQKDVAIYILPVAEEPDGECDHLGYETYEGEDYVAPTCTTTGLTATVYCSNCDAVVKEQEELPISHEGQGTYVEGYVAPGCETEGATGITYCSNCKAELSASEVIEATGHDYEDGACNNCGEEEPSAPELTGYVQVTDVADITAGGQFVIVADNGGTYLALGTSISGKIVPTTVTVAGGVVTSENPPVWEIKAVSGGIALYNGSSYLSYNSSTNFKSDSAPYTWVVEGASEGTFYITSAATTRGVLYQLAGGKFGAYAISNRTSAEYVGALLLYKLVEEEVDPNACTHELTEVTAGYPATCTAAGKEDTLSCKCGQNVQEGAEIPALGHSYDDDYCTACGIINPEAAKQAEAIDGLPQAGDVIIFYHPGSKVAMAAAPNNDRMGAVSTTKASGVIPYSATHTAVLTVEQVGDYFRFEMGGLYLTTSAKGNTLSFAALPAEGETDLTLWKVTPAVSYDWGVNICSVNATYNGTDYNQTIEYYNDQFYPYGFNGKDYISSFQIQIGLISRIELPPVVEMDGVQYTSFEEAYAYDPDTTIKLLADFDEINVTGDLYLDLNGHTVGSVTANWIYAGDSSATAEAAGTGKLTTASPVETTETIGSTKYVALKDEHGVYTFHVLDLKLSAVTLRTNKAGIYYKAEMACDEVLAGQIDYHGVAVSIVGMPTADFANEANTAATKISGAPEGVFTSGSVTNIFRENLSAEKNAARGEINIYANSYIQLLDGTILMGANESAKSMKDIMTYLDTNYATLEAADQANALAFYETWADAMAGWELANLAAAIAPETEEAA